MREATPVVDRRHLLQSVHAARPTLIVVVAPAGFGKSRFARDLSTAYPAARTLDLSPISDEVSAALSVRRSLGLHTEADEHRFSRELLSLRDLPRADMFAMDVLEDVLASAKIPDLLIVENAETAAGNRAATLVLDRLVARRTTMVICSRIVPMARAIARVPPNERLDINTADLAFSDSESRSLFSGTGATPQSIERVIALSRGWPIAVLLFLRAAANGDLETIVRQAEEGQRHAQLADYVVAEGLSGFSPRCRAVLAAVSRAGSIDVEDLVTAGEPVTIIMREVAGSALVDVNAGRLSLHPLAAAALRDSTDGDLVLRRIATAIKDDAPSRAATLLLSVGDDDAAADAMDRRLNLFGFSQPTAADAAIVSSFSKSVLLHHPITWSTTISHRAYAMSGHQLLHEARAVWSTLAADAPLSLIVSVGLVLANSLILMNQRTEVDALFEELHTRFREGAENALNRGTVAMWRAFSDLRRGRRVSEKNVWAEAKPILKQAPVVEAQILYSFSGPIAFLEGDRTRSRWSFARAAELSRLPGAEIIRVIALQNVAFFSWLAGETDQLAFTVDELAAESGPTVAEGTRYFLACARGSLPGDAQYGFELPYLRVFGTLIAASRERQAARRVEALRKALRSAEDDGQPWLRALVSATLSASGADGCAGSASEARLLAREVEYPAFHDLIEQLLAHRPQPIISNVSRFLRAPTAALRISIAHRSAEIDGSRLSLSGREFEILLALALRNGPCENATLAAMIWPDLDEMAGANSVRVAIARLRKRIGIQDVIRSSRAGYELAVGVTVDLFEIEAAAATDPADLTDDTLDIVRKRQRLPQSVLVSEWLQPYIRRYELACFRILTRLEEHALRLRQHQDAVGWRSLIEIDPLQ